MMDTQIKSEVPADLSEYAKDLIHGTGGWIALETYELVVTPDRDVAIAAWVLRCLANTDSETARYVVSKLAVRHDIAMLNPATSTDESGSSWMTGEHAEQIEELRLNQGGFDPDDTGYNDESDAT